MEKCGLVPPLEVPVCRLVMGTGFGRPLEQPCADRLFDAYVGAGGNCFDTALVYYDAEVTLGRWIRARDIRAKVVIHAKGAHHEDGVRRVHPSALKADLEETLTRLGTNYVDIYTLHRDDPERPVGPLLECLAEEKARGRIRAYGASNWTIPRLERAAEYAERHGIDPFALSSPELSLAVPAAPPWPGCVNACDAASREWYVRTGLPLFAWSAVAMGYFNIGLESVATAAPSRSGLPPGVMSQNEVARVFDTAENRERRTRAAILAAERHATPTQMALSWLLHQPLNGFAVVGPRSVGEVESLFRAFDLVLSSQEADWLNLEQEWR